MATRQIPNLTPVVFLSPTAQLEIVQDGTTYRASALQIAGLGGLTVTNDTTDPVKEYPLFSKQTAGTLTSVFTSNANYTYQPLQGLLSVLRPEATQGIVFNNSASSLDYIFPTGDNATSCGPLTLNAIITIPTGSEWVVL